MQIVRKEPTGSLLDSSAAILFIRPESSGPDGDADSLHSLFIALLLELIVNL